MKLKQLITTACAALASLVFLAPSAKATLPYNNGDLILGFRATGGAGATSDYEVNLGNATVYTTAVGTVTPSIGNIKADLDALYGAGATGWSARGDVLWSVSAVVQPAANGFTNNTMFATREQPAVGTQSTPWPRPSTFAAGAPANKMVAMASSSFGYAAGTNVNLNQTESANSAVGLLQATSGGNCYASYQPGGTNTTGVTAFGYFSASTGIEGTFANGTAGTVLDFYQVAPGSGASVLVGTFTIDDNAVVKFTKAGAATTANVHFSAATYSGSEAIAGQQIAVAITRDGDLSGTATVNFSTSDGTAVAGTDFTGQTNTPVSFAANETSKNVLVDVVHRAGFQGNRSFTVTLSGPGAGTAVTAPSTATVTITEVDPNAGAIAFSSATYTAPEVDAQSAFSLVPVTFSRTGGTTGAVTADLAVTAGGTLVNGTDFNTIANPTTVSFADGATTATVNIQLKAIAPGNLPGTINLGLTNPTNSATLGATTSATVTINPVTANVHFSNVAYSGSEVIVGGQIPIAINRDGNLAKPFTVNFSTTNTGTAVAGTDYTAQTNTPVTFAANDTTKTVMVDIAHIVGFQGNRTFGVSLTSPTTGATVNAPATATVTILEDEAAPAGAIAFSAATVQANALNGSNNPNTVVLSLTRSNGATGAVTADVSVTGGTLVSGTDYTFTTPVTVNFANNATTATVNIPLNAIAANKLPGTITLGLGNATGGATIGAVSSTTVTIVSPGVLAFGAATYKFNPVDAHAAPNTLAIGLTRASGFNGAVAVDVSLSGGTLANGTDYTFTSPTTVHFADGATTATLNIPLNTIPTAKLPGTIILHLGNAAGGAGLGTQATANITVLKPDLVLPTVTAISPLPGGTVVPSFTLTGKALDAKGIDRVEVSLNKAPVQLATLGAFANGSLKYTLANIQPENGKNTLTITAVDSSGNKSLPLNLSVIYLNNRPAFAGSYNGLLVPAVTPANSLSGLVKLKVTATGNFTGNVALGGFTVPVSGVFGNDGTAHFKPKLATTLALVGPAVAPAVPTALGTLALGIATDGTLGAKITGTLNSDPVTVAATLSAPRSFFNGLTPATSVDTRYTLLNKGHFTLVFPAKAQGALPTTAFPQGDGYANLTLTAAGAVSVTGKLADGTAFSAAATLAADYSWPFFAKLFGGKGSLAGLTTFDDSQALSDLSGANLLWFRPAKSASKYYPAGWPAGLQLDLLGAKYVKTTGTSVLPGLGALDPANGNATLVFSDGKLSGPLSKNLNIDPNNVVTNAPLTDKSFLLTIAKGTGQLAGSFKHSDLTKPLFSGILFQKGANAGGYGFFLSTVPLTPGATGESGGVSLSAK